MASTDNKLILAAIETLRRRLPGGWKVIPRRGRFAPPDAIVEIRAADESTGRLVIETKTRLEPRGVDAIAALAEKAPTEERTVVVSAYLSPSTTERLRSTELSYLDLTGNVRLVLARPGLFIETQGATTAHDRKPGKSQNY